MYFELSNQPDYLVISDPSNILETQMEVVAEHHTHWINAYRASFSKVDLGMHALNATFATEFTEASISYMMGQTSDTPETEEAFRQSMVTLLAMSGLARKIAAHPDIAPTDAIGNQKSPQIMIDVYDKTSRFHMVHEAHTLILPECNNPDRWYRDGDLFVRRTIPAELSDGQQLVLSKLNMQVDPATMATLYPYIGRG